jgi:hypothetical protein
MKNNFKKFFLLFTIIVTIIAINACKKEDQDIDKELYESAQKTEGFVWYKKTNAALSKSAGSGHSQPYLRTRYNAIAATKLEANGKIIPNSSFPEGSLIVKELLSNTSTIDRYAILLKASSNKNADTKGWVWGYVDANGKVIESATKKGSACINCHSQSDNIDYMLMNKYFP